MVPGVQPELRRAVLPPQVPVMQLPQQHWGLCAQHLAGCSGISACVCRSSQQPENDMSSVCLVLLLMFLITRRRLWL